MPDNAAVQSWRRAVSKLLNVEARIVVGSTNDLKIARSNYVSNHARLVFNLLPAAIQEQIKSGGDAAAAHVAKQLLDKEFVLSEHDYSIPFRFLDPHQYKIQKSARGPRDTNRKIRARPQKQNPPEAPEAQIQKSARGPRDKNQKIR